MKIARQVIKGGLALFIMIVGLPFLYINYFKFIVTGIVALGLLGLSWSVGMFIENLFESKGK